MWLGGKKTYGEGRAERVKGVDANADAEGNTNDLRGRGVKPD